MDLALPLLLSLTVLYGAACGTLGAEQSAPLWLRWPAPLWNLIAHSWRPANTTPRRPDYVKIAVLEYEIFGIEPKPGTDAAACVNVRRALAPLRDE